MVTKNEIKFIKSLRDKSFRNKFNLFIVEGEKSINEFLNSNYKVYKIYSTHPANISYNDVIQISEKQLIQISSLKTPNKHIAIFNKTKFPVKNQKNYFVLDSVNDPGNLGTMIRTSKSFGINNILLSDEITDVYNPNVIRASIGHLFNSNISSGSNDEIISLLEANDYQVLLLDPEGDESLEGFIPNQNFALVVGAEQYGISDNWFNSNYTSLFIRSTNNVDSINASTAAAIAMWELTK